MKSVRVNVKTVANVAAIRRDKRNGRDVIIVPSATLPDNIVMNGVMYPAAEIAKSFKGLERTPAPLGHPMVNGKFVSARDPEGINVGWVGAFNANVRQEGGRVLLDKVIDVQRAKESEGGRALLNAIDKGEPIHTSTGLLCNLEAVNGADHKYLARNMTWDHDAILLNEEGAATPDQGVGMLVNANGEPEEIEVINSAYTAADQDLDWAIQSLASALDKRQRAPFLEQMKSAILSVFTPAGAGTLNKKEDDMAVSDEQFKELSEKVNALAEGFNKIGETVGTQVANAVKPLLDAQAELTAANKAKDEAEHAALVDKVVKANLLNEAAAKEAPLSTLRALAPLTEPGKAANLNTRFDLGNAADDEFKDYGVDAVNKLMEAR
jgi:hypothetical protein